MAYELLPCKVVARCLARPPDNLAQAFAVAGRFAEAIPHYEAAFRLSPSLPGLEYNWAVALENAGDREGAKKLFEQARNSYSPP